MAGNKQPSTTLMLSVMYTASNIATSYLCHSQNMSSQAVSQLPDLPSLPSSAIEL
jgi:hypothetical protein